MMPPPAALRDQVGEQLHVVLSSKLMLMHQTSRMLWIDA
jgi:hypothetical protein